jgi:hypothetical protein
MGRPPIPALKRELRFRQFGEQVQQDLDRQMKQHGREVLEKALDRVRRRQGFRFSQRTAHNEWKRYKRWQAQGQQVSVETMIVGLAGFPLYQPLATSLLETTAPFRGGARSSVQLAQVDQERIRPIEKGPPPMRTAALSSWRRR